MDLVASPGVSSTSGLSAAELDLLRQVERKVLWLSTYLVHHANFVRESNDSIKVGGHQASCASVVSLLTAYYFHAARAGDLISIKPHASPVYHAIQFLLGNLPARYLTELRAFGGLQAYPSRTKDPDGVHFSTGSVGLGAVIPNFSALVRRYVADHFAYPGRHRFVSLIGDAELDEGNVWEALGEDTLQQQGDVIWLVDLNRQSLDRVVPNGRVQTVENMLRAFGCHVIEIKYGRKLETMFAQPGGDRLRSRIDLMTNDEYQSLLRAPDPELVRSRLARPDGKLDPALEGLLRDYPAAELRPLIADLGGHDLEAILRAFDEADRVHDRPVVIIAYTVKGWGLPTAGDPLNHSRLLTAEQIETLREDLGISPGGEFAGFAPESQEAALAGRMAERLRVPAPPPRALPEVPASLNATYPVSTSTQQVFGNLVSELARHPELRARLVTTCPDVAISTNLGGWIQKAGVYFPEDRIDFFRENAVQLLLNWRQNAQGQHIELGISENNLFLMLGALGLSGDLFGERLIPIGTVYDTFIARGLDALNYAVYNGARFLFAGTPSGISLSGEGGAHQSIYSPSIGIEMPRLTFYEPCFAQEVDWILMHGIRRILHGESAECFYLRLSTVPQEQKLAPAPSEDLRAQVLAGGYRYLDHSAKAGYRPGENVVNLFTSGVMLPLALEAARDLEPDGVFVNVINVTSAGLLHREWGRARRARTAFQLEQLIPPAERRVPLVTVADAHPHALSFLGSVFGAPVQALGVDDFGQSGERADLYRYYELGPEAMVRAVLAALD